MALDVGAAVVAVLPTEGCLETWTAAIVGLEERDGAEPMAGTFAGAAVGGCRRGVTVRDGGVAVLEVDTETAGVRGAEGSEVGNAMPPKACRTGVETKSEDGTGGTVKDSLGGGAAKYFGSKEEAEAEALREPMSAIDDVGIITLLELL